MKINLLVILCFVVVSVFAATTNEVLFVNEKDEVNRPGVLATTAQMAANKAAILTAEQKAEAAEAAAREGTNLIQDVIRDITSNELKVWRFGYTDAFGVAVVLDPNAQLHISAFDPLDERDSAGRQGFYMEYQLHNSQPVATKPAVKWGSTIAGGTAAFDALPADQVMEPISMGTVTDKDGKEWYKYKLTFYAPQGNMGFYIIDLTPDDAAGNGWTFDLPNGIKGGRSGKFMFGTVELEFVGGLCME